MLRDESPARQEGNPSIRGGDSHTRFRLLTSRGARRIDSGCIVRRATGTSGNCSGPLGILDPSPEPSRQEHAMQVAIVYDSSTGKTKAAAERMAEMARAAGHECTVASIQDADPAAVSGADAVCVGSWTKGLFIVLQGPTKATLDFIDRLGPLEGKPAAVFATYDVATGRTLPKMATRLAAHGANVSGQFKSKGPKAAEVEFGAWLRTL
jgi:flavodoxin